MFSLQHESRFGKGGKDRFSLSGDRTLVRRLAKERVTCKTGGRIISDLCLNIHYTSQHSDIYAYHEQSLHVNLWPSSSNLNISFTRFINGSTVCGIVYSGSVRLYTHHKVS